MQLAEVGKLLAIIASFDNRRLEDSTAFAWKMMLDRHYPDATLAECQEVVLDWFGTANPYFEVRHLLDGLRRRRRGFSRQVEGDVRSAKARGLVAKSWPDRKPLPTDVAAKLETARQTAREVAGRYEVEGPNVSPLALDVGRRL
ncbi:MAG: hypothetical protein ACK5LO_02450 [Leucobacter sp.]